MTRIDAGRSYTSEEAIRLLRARLPQETKRIHLDFICKLASGGTIANKNQISGLEILDIESQMAGSLAFQDIYNEFDDLRLAKDLASSKEVNRYAFYLGGNKRVRKEQAEEMKGRLRELYNGEMTKREVRSDLKIISRADKVLRESLDGLDPEEGRTRTRAYKSTLYKLFRELGIPTKYTFGD